MSIRKGGQVIAGTPNITTGHHVGEIFWTSRLDNELNGAVDADGATYSVEAFTGDKSVPALLANGKLPSVSMAEYESIVSANGSCRAWGWDNGDTFRVPTLKALLLTKEQAAVVGNGMTLGLQKDDNVLGMAGYSTGSFVALGPSVGTAGTSFGSSATTAGGSINVTYGVTTDPEKSGIVANLDVIEYRAMVQLSTGATDEALMTCTGVLADVADLKQTTLRADQITNCITEIPQDIKLEIESASVQVRKLILKAGSKVYVSTNGTFNAVTIQSDIVGGDRLWTTDHSRELFAVYVPSTNSIDTLPVAHCFSQSTAPTSFLASLYAGWFDTSTNTVKYTIDGGNNWTICSLPICLGRPGADYVGWNGYLDQVFNGFGYIGSTIFALPGVKGLIPNGRNEDGSYANHIEEITSVKTYTFTSESGSVALYYDSDTQSIGAAYTGTYIYDSSTNSYVNKVTGVNVTTLINVANCICTSGKISSFKFADVDSVANSNASNFSQAGRSYLSGLGMPSGKYINLTLGASGSTYTAPANGYFYIAKNSGANNQYLTMGGNGVYTRANVATSGNTAVEFVPVKKDASILINYNLSGTTNTFRFIYAEGENS